MNTVSDTTTGGDRPEDPNYSMLFTVEHERSVMQLLGPGTAVLQAIEAQFPGIRISVRGHDITLSGAKDQVKSAYRLLETAAALAEDGQQVSGVDLAASQLRRTEGSDSGASAGEGAAGATGAAGAVKSASAGVIQFGEVILSTRGKTIRPKTAGQQQYVEAISQHTIVFGIGPAGTGKTYLAMAKAVQALQQKQVSRIILTRPAVEAGERLGYLPGTLTDKIDPYLRPLFDALNEMMDPELVTKLIGLGTIEVAPLAYMRGRTLNDSFIILDEAQNTTEEQMKMFLTRLGFGSQMVVTGDITQIDLPGGVSGLRQVQKILNNVEDIEFAELSSKDVVRHTLVGKIVDAYSRFDETSQNRRQHQLPGQRRRATPAAQEKGTGA